jgi:thiol:disulfide interchange protein DsbC
VLKGDMFVRILLAFLILFFIFSSGYSYGFETRGQDCSKCHTLTGPEAKNLLNTLYPDVKVIEIGVSPLKAAWEVFIELGNNKGIVYIDFSKKHMVLGSIISIKEKRNLTQERFAELNKVDVSQIPLSEALVLGDEQARIRVIVFTDPD